MTDTFDNRLVRVPIYTSAPEDPPATGPEPSLLSRFSNRLLSMLDQIGVAGLPEGEQRERVKTARNKLLHIGPMEEQDYLWPERMLRSAVTLPGDVATGRTPLLPPGLRREDLTDVPVPTDRVGGTPYDEVIQRTQDTAGLAMTGGLAGTGGGGMVVGSGATMPKRYLLPAVRTPEGKIVKGEAGMAHGEIAPELSGVEGFVNHKGHFLSRERAMEYAKEHGLIDNAYEKLADKNFALTADYLAAKNEAAAPLSALERGPTWYSPVEQALENSTTARATGAQWLATLKNSRGVKPEELDWTGLRSFLEERKDAPISRPELHEYLRDNRVELQDVTKGGRLSANWEDLTSEQRKSIRDAYHEHLEEEHAAMGEEPPSRPTLAETREWYPTIDPSDLENLIGDNYKGTKYHDYQLPGGENYREHLITMPVHSPRAEAVAKEAGYGSAANMSEGALERRGIPRPYRSSHWDEPNIVAHVRSNVREMPEPLTPEQQAAVTRRAELLPQLEKLRAREQRIATQIQQDRAAVQRVHEAKVRDDLQSGKITPARASRAMEEYVPLTKAGEQLQRELADVRMQQDALEVPPEVKQTSKRSLHLEEVQSDWHQTGRRKGYALDEAEKAERRKLQDRWIEEGEKLPDADKRRLSELMAREKGGEVTDAPWKKTWHELALRRMIRLAAEEGMDRISWTPGEAQAARYDLSKTVSEIRAMRNNDGTYRLAGLTDRAGSYHDFGREIPADKLPDYVGKDLADKIVKQEKNDHIYKGQDLKVGGEGMRGFYDKMMVQAAEKLGKEYGVKVVEGEIPQRLDVHVARQRHDMDAPTWNALSAAEKEKLLSTPQKVWYFDIPPAMREAALSRGMPLFSGGKMFVPSGAQRSEESEK